MGNELSNFKSRTLLFAIELKLLSGQLRKAADNKNSRLFKHTIAEMERCLNRMKDIAVEEKEVSTVLEIHDLLDELTIIKKL